MSTKEKCADPKAGKGIERYNREAEKLFKEENLTLEDVFKLSPFEEHLISCPYCRKRLTSMGRSEFGYKLFNIGFFLDDAVLVRERMQLILKHITEEDSVKEYPKPTREEYLKSKDFLRGKDK
jgi:hypothetical protein